MADRTTLPLDVEDFALKFGCGIASLPRNVVLAGWSAADDRWYCGPASSYATESFDRVPPTIGFLDGYVRPRLAGGSFWSMLCFWDGWRERHPFSERYTWVPAGDLADCAEWRGAPGELPILSPGRPHPRRHLAAIAQAARLDVDVHLGKGVPRALQMSRKWILDVDGFTRTWDAFAWKMRSGSVVLSPASPWESFFTRQFEPWAHFVPLANDFSDLGEKLDWCRANDDEYRQIAERARQRSDWVCRPETVARIVARPWRTLLA